MNKIYYAILFLTFCSITTFAGIQENHSNKIMNPEYNDSKYYRGLIKIASLEQTNTATILKITHKDTFGGDTIGTMINILKSSYLEDNDTKKRYQLLKAENIPYSPEFHRFKNTGDSLTFSLYFEPLPSSVKSFDFIEPAPKNKGFLFNEIKFKARREIPDSIKSKYQNKDIKRLGFVGYAIFDSIKNIDGPHVVTGAVILDQKAKTITTIFNDKITSFYILDEAKQLLDNGNNQVFYKVSLSLDPDKPYTYVVFDYYKDHKKEPLTIMIMSGEKKVLVLHGFYELDEYDLPQNK